jgi:hypothetical protein
MIPAKQTPPTVASLKRPITELSPGESDGITHEQQNKKARRVTHTFEALSDVDAIGASFEDEPPSRSGEQQQQQQPSIRRVSVYQEEIGVVLQPYQSPMDNERVQLPNTAVADQQETPYRITSEMSGLNFVHQFELIETSSSSDGQETNSTTTDESEGDYLLDGKQLSELLQDSATSSETESETEEPSPKATRRQHPVVRRRSSLSSRRASMKGHKTRKSSLVAAIGMALCLFFFASQSPPNLQEVDPNSVFVSGGGFSGFWFSIGRLQSIEDPASKEYYCYSAGCLAVVAALASCDVNQMADMCFGVQDRWNAGETKHHDVVRDFLDNFLETPNVKDLLNDQDKLAKIHIITSVRDGWFGVKSAIRSPATRDDLYEMLLQTTWIPFATGESLWDSSNGEYHMDGIFSPKGHPICAHNLGLPWTWDLRANALNVNLGLDKVKKFWNEGLAYGL